MATAPVARPWPLRMLTRVRALLRRFAVLLVVLIVALVGIRAWWSTQGPALRPWHTIVPRESSVDAIERGNWATYVAAESRMFDDLHRALGRKLEAQDRTPINRYADGSLASPRAFGRDWNRSYVLEPAAPAHGVAVLLHGLSDSPYSMRALAELYRAHGFVALVPRMPGHGTVPAGLTREGRQEWEATVAMAMREATRRANGKPVHLVGYSNGGALALVHVMRRIANGQGSDAQRIVLLSPMIEVDAFARYAGLAGVPAYFGRYAKSAWLDLLPEYNPFKYNSFPVRAARESYLVTADLQEAMAAVRAKQAMAHVPPILAFQSVVDDTVSAPAVMTRLFDALPANGSELVLYDVHRNRMLDPILRDAATTWSRDALAIDSRNYALTVIGAMSEADSNAVARTRRPGATSLETQALGVRYPPDVYSLSHIALPFPGDDPLYGHVPARRPLVQLGTIAVRGERNTLAVSQDSLNRLTWNPFFDAMAARIAADIP